MTETILSPDMQEQMPHFHLKSEVVRSHKEILVHPLFKWIKREVVVVDQLKFVGITVRQAGRTWEIPLAATVEKDPDTLDPTE